ncbi:MAG: hypothetical protein ACRCU2_14815 [Planktothrix sp.]
MQSQKINILEDGTFVLPDELRESLKNSPELWMAWNEELIIINRKSVAMSQEAISQTERIQRFFASADKLSQFNEIAPISEDEIQAEIEAYRSEKRTNKRDGV